MDLAVVVLLPAKFLLDVPSSRSLGFCYHCFLSHLFKQVLVMIFTVASPCALFSSFVDSLILLIPLSNGSIR